MSPVVVDDDRLAVDKLIDDLSTLKDEIPFSECMEDAVTTEQKILAMAQDELGALISKLENAKVGNVKHGGSQG